MSTKTIGVVGRGSGWQKVGIELGPYVFHPNSSQLGMFQTFASQVNLLTCKQVRRGTPLPSVPPPLAAGHTPPNSLSTLTFSSYRFDRKKCLQEFKSSTKLFFVKIGLNLENFYNFSKICK